MTDFRIFDALKGTGGQAEVQRVLGAFGTVIYAIAVPAFVAFGVIGESSVTEFCLAYPAGLAACIGATAGAIALKDRSVATSQVIRETGAHPTIAAPPPADTNPQPVNVAEVGGKPV